jgi:hypothetical protein
MSKKPRGRGGHSPRWAAETEIMIIMMMVIIIIIIIIIIMYQVSYNLTTNSGSTISEMVTRNINNSAHRSIH